MLSHTNVKGIHRLLHCMITVQSSTIVLLRSTVDYRIAGYFRGSKFRFLINIAQTPPMTINFRELNICGMALYHEKHDN